MDSPIEIPQIKPETSSEVTTPPIADSKAQSPKEHNQTLVNSQALPTQPLRRRADSLNAPTPVKKPNKFFVVGIALAAILLFLSFSFLLTFFKARAFYADAKGLYSAAKAQNIPEIKTKLVKAKKSLKGLRSSFSLLSWLKIIPLAGGYVADAGHSLAAASYGLEALDVTITTTEPYADILGFGGGGGDGAKTAQERIDFFVKAIPDLIPKSDQIAKTVGKAKTELDQINANRYPVRIGQRQIREPLRKGLQLFDQGAAFVSQVKPLLEAAPYLLGLNETRQYLVLFQNDKELRPTGGFMTAYSIMKVDKAKAEPTVSSDIYNLDARYKPVFPAPEPLIKYIKGPYILSGNLRLRDMNWSPDFSVSMAQFLPEAKKLDLGQVDGVIAVDTQLLVNLLDVIGPIGVPGFGNFSTQIEPKCNCPQVIYELESFADVEGPIIWDPVTGKIIYRPPNSDNRKKIIGPLMNSILANALGQPKEKIPALFEAGFKSLLEKHVLLYLVDAKTQSQVDAFGIAGTIKDYNGDYLHINDSNLGGRKSNLYVTQEVSQEIKVAKDGTVEKTLTLTYKNPQKQDGWLNSVLPDWVRIYVPKGSQLISSEGFEDKADPYEDLDKTVFAGYFELRPEGVAKISVTYKLPFKVKGEYKLLLQKQPGTDAPLYTIQLAKQNEEFFLRSDKELRLKI